jgi:hypothetical protein
MSSQTFWNPVRDKDMCVFSRIFVLWIDFDDLHFTDSPNGHPLIVRSS